MRYRKIIERYRANQQEEQFHVAFSDLFAGMIGVTMIFVVFFFSSVAVSHHLNKKSDFADNMAKNITEIKYGAGKFYEPIYVYSNRIRVVRLNNKVIKVSKILKDKELEEYLKNLYARGGEALFKIFASKNYIAKNKLSDLLYELSRKDERMIHFNTLFIHENCEFVANKEMKELCLNNWENKNNESPFK